MRGPQGPRRGGGARGETRLRGRTAQPRLRQGACNAASAMATVDSLASARPPTRCNIGSTKAGQSMIFATGFRSELLGGMAKAR
eukprot:842040-Pyramimonas_sp.AAC.1